MTTSRFVLLTILSGFAAGSAQAALSFNVQWDAELIDGFVVNTITIDADSDLSGVGATSQLVSGTLNQLAAPPAFPDAETALATIDLGPGDSFVTINGDPFTGAPVGGGVNTGGEALAIFNSSQIDLTWSNFGSNDIGNGLLVARLVFSDDANGSFQMIAVSIHDLNFTRADNLILIVNGFLVPEPASLSLMGVGGLAALRRRRR